MKTALGALLAIVAVLLAWLFAGQVATIAFKQTISPVMKATAAPRPSEAPLASIAPLIAPTPYVLPSDIARKYGVTAPPASDATPDPVFTQQIIYTTTAEPTFTPQ